MPERIVSHTRVEKQVNNTKNCLLREALRLFSSQGYEKTTIKTVAESCAVDRTVVYHHYGNKQKLAIACLNEQQKRYKRALFAHISDCPTQRQVCFVLARLKRFIVRLPNLIPILPHHLLITFIVECPTVTRHMVDQFLGQWHLFFYRLLSGRYPACKAYDLATSQLVRWMGACVFASVYDANTYLLDCWTELNSLLDKD